MNYKVNNTVPNTRLFRGLTRKHKKYQADLFVDDSVILIKRIQKEHLCSAMSASAHILLPSSNNSGWNVDVYAIKLSYIEK